MQKQTTTITTETITVEHLPLTIATFEQTTTAFCDCCDNQSSGTKDELKRRGWFLGQREEFCPNCNF